MALTDALQNNFRSVFADSLKKQLDPISDDNYYFFFGKVTPWTDETTPPTLVDSVSEKFSAYRNGLFAIRLDSRNISFVIPRINWSSGTVFTQYDDASDQNDPDSTVKYYVLVDGTSLYKCISNNNGGISTISPSQTGTSIFTTSDNYKWKFLCTLTDDQLDFLTEEYVPIGFREKSEDTTATLQYEVQEKAIDGSIYKIDISGLSITTKYTDAVITARDVFQSVSAGSTKVKLNPNDTNTLSASSSYVGYTFYVSGGPGQGQNIRISSYDATNKILTLESSLQDALVGSETDGNSKFKILPEVLINGDGVNAKAALDTSGIIIINAGQDYTKAFLTFPTPIASGQTAPTGRVHIGPKSGHGGNIITEFDASKIILRVLNDNVEGQPEIINVNDYRQFGIIKNPILNDNSLRLAGNEFDRKVEFNIRKPYGYCGGNYQSAGSDNATFKENEYVYGKDTMAVAMVSSWEPSTEGQTGKLILKNPSRNFRLPSTDQETIRVNFGTSGGTGEFNLFETVTQYNTTLGITATGVVKDWNSVEEELIIRLSATGENGAVPFSAGITSHIIGTVSGAERHDHKNLESEAGELLATFGVTTGIFNSDTESDIFIGRIDSGNNVYIDASETPVYRMTTNLDIAPTSGSLASNNFALDAGVTQQNTNRLLTTATVASWTPNAAGTTGSLVLTDVLGGFSAGGTLHSPQGTNFSVTSISEPRLVQGSGEVLYIQNVRSIDRQKNQREEIRILIGF